MQICVRSILSVGLVRLAITECVELVCIQAGCEHRFAGMLAVCVKDVQFSGF